MALLPLLLLVKLLLVLLLLLVVAVMGLGLGVLWSVQQGRPAFAELQDYIFGLYNLGKVWRHKERC
jgi:hypothetical protein